MNTEWDGKNNPPIGSLCTVDMLDGTRAAVHILAYGNHDSDAAVLLAQDHYGKPGVMHGFLVDQCEFLRIESPEEIAANKRRAGVAELMRLAGITDSAFAEDPEAQVWAAALYDHGVRAPAE